MKVPRIPRRWLPVIAFVILGASMIAALIQIQTSRAEGKRQTCAAIEKTHDGLQQILDIFKPGTQPGTEGAEHLDRVQKIIDGIKCGPKPRPLVRP